MFPKTLLSISKSRSETEREFDLLHDAVMVGSDVCCGTELKYALFGHLEYQQIRNVVIHAFPRTDDIILNKEKHFKPSTFWFLTMTKDFPLDAIND